MPYTDQDRKFSIIKLTKSRKKKVSRVIFNIKIKKLKIFFSGTVRKGTHEFAWLYLKTLISFRGKVHRNNMNLASSFLEDFLDFVSNTTLSITMSDINIPTLLT